MNDTPHAEPVPVAVLDLRARQQSGRPSRSCRPSRLPGAAPARDQQPGRCAGLALAAAHGVPSLVVPHRDFPSREGFEQAVHDALTTAGIRLVALAGFLRRLTPAFCRAWEGRMLNIHPSLLPSFPGLDTHARALEAGVRIHGCTVHLVTPELDSGPILAQAAVPVLPGDSEATLAARVLAAEHRIYPMALAALASARVGVDGQRTAIAGATWPDQALLVPDP